MPDPTLPTIVAAIRKQRPGLLPEWIHHDPGDEDYPACWWLASDGYTREEDGLSPTVPISDSQVAPIVESCLWRAYFSTIDGIGAIRKYDKWFAWYGEEKERAFPLDDPLSLIRALCWALGIELATP